MTNSEARSAPNDLSLERALSPFAMRLREEWTRRMKQNPRYSLRAFARFLEVEPSFLSKLLSGKRAVTETTLLRLGEKIGLTPEDYLRYRETLDAARARRMRELQALIQRSPSSFN